MVVRSPTAVLLVTIAVVLAGCSSKDLETALPPTSSAPIGEVHCEGDFCTGNTTGLEGTVTNEEAFPVEAVEVALVELSLSVLSDEAGRYVFREIPAGTYTLVATKLGYESFGKKIEVVEGTITSQGVQLRAVAVVEPYHETSTYRGRVACGVAGVSPCAVFLLFSLTGQADPSGNAQGMAWHYEDEYPDTVILEVVWQPTATATGQALTYGFFTSLDGLERSYIAQGNQGSPIYIRASEAQLLAAYDEYASDFNFILYPDSEGATFQQDFSLFRTDFYNGEAPDNWTFVPDA
jgi:hypothetical protein